MAWSRNSVIAVNALNHWKGHLWISRTWPGKVWMVDFAVALKVQGRTKAAWFPMTGSSMSQLVFLSSCNQIRSLGATVASGTPKSMITYAYIYIYDMYNLTKGGYSEQLEDNFLCICLYHIHSICRLVGRNQRLRSSAPCFWMPSGS